MVKLFGFGKKKDKEVEEQKTLSEETSEELPKAKKVGFFQKLKESLKKTRDRFTGQLKNLFSIGKKVDQNTLDELEEILISSDMGFEVAEGIKKSVDKAYRNKDIEGFDGIKLFIQNEIKSMLSEGLEKTGKPIVKINTNGPTIITIIGVNGSGKTTSIAKLANHLQKQNYSVMLAAADTFRAAAVEQLSIWGQRLNIPVIKSGVMGVDPASVIYDATDAAVSKKVDFLIIDTAGRLHTQRDLMSQLDKMHKVIDKKIPGAPHETILILDGTTGQNAVVQGAEFGKVHKITGVVMTKLDGSAKGGVLIRICKELQIPVRYIGVGEGIDDLEVFDSNKYVEALFD